jgi:hypothetical protein
MFMQTASGIRTDEGAMTPLGLTPERIVGHLTTDRFLQWWSEGDDSFAVDPPNAGLDVIAQAVLGDRRIRHDDHSLLWVSVPGSPQQAKHRRQDAPGGITG